MLEEMAAGNKLEPFLLLNLKNVFLSKKNELKNTKKLGNLVSFLGIQ